MLRTVEKRKRGGVWTTLSQDISRLRSLDFPLSVDTSLALCKHLFCTLKSPARYLGSAKVFVMEG